MNGAYDRRRDLPFEPADAKEHPIGVLRSLTNRVLRSLTNRVPQSLTNRVPQSLANRVTIRSVTSSRPRRTDTEGGRWSLRGWLPLPNLLIALWLLTLCWGERWVFSNSIRHCDWRYWESWPTAARPHHLAFVADPQLVDPHTYPGRPWPLSTLTVRYTDLYLKRVYSLLQQRLYPDSTVFLGDLFDGGREWTSNGDAESDKRWRKYGDEFWLKEYKRFGKIFFDPWIDAGATCRGRATARRKLLTNLPGNHDLGFATGIHQSVKNRFNAYFGDGNRVDILGNHTFISLDTVSLSAKEYAESDDEIWLPASDFLSGVQRLARKALHSELKFRKDVHRNPPPFPHAVFDAEDLSHDSLREPDTRGLAQLPTILLTHVPLFRDSGKPCGPFRERWPPTLDGNGDPLLVDERNAIRVAAGYQYQNVLTRELSREITEKIGNVHYAFSGDDHDYCEVVHRGYPSAGSGIREITVKSISWAMGVRKPGFVLLSLWNPIDDKGNSIDATSGHGNTIQTHLCLLPDQLGIFKCYAFVLIQTVVFLLLRAGHLALNPTKSSLAGSESPILPVVREHLSAEMEKAESSPSDDGSGKSSMSSERTTGLSARSLNPRVRGVSPTTPLGSYGLPAPLIDRAGYFGPAREIFSVETKAKSKFKRLKGVKLFYAEFRWSVVRVASVVLPCYFWLLWNG